MLLRAEKLSAHSLLAAGAAVLVLLVDEAHVIELLEVVPGRGRAIAELADPGAERVRDVLERR